MTDFRNPVETGGWASEEEVRESTGGRAYGAGRSCTTRLLPARVDRCRVSTRDGSTAPGDRAVSVLVTILDERGLAVGVQATSSNALEASAAEIKLDGGKYTVLAGDAPPGEYTIGTLARMRVLRRLQTAMGTEAKRSP